MELAKVYIHIAIAMLYKHLNEELSFIISDYMHAQKSTADYLIHVQV